MRFFLLLLILLNLGLWAYIDYETQRPTPGATALAQQIKPERIRLMSAQEVTGLEPPREVCLELGPLAAVDAMRARETVLNIHAGAQISERRAEPQVFLQVRNVPEAARRKLADAAPNLGGAELRVCPAEAKASSG